MAEAARIRVQVQRSLCQGHAMCFALAPGIYQLDDLGYNAVDGVFEVDDAHAEEARRGAQACPERAITITEPERASDDD